MRRTIQVLSLGLNCVLLVWLITAPRPSPIPGASAAEKPSMKTLRATRQRQYVAQAAGNRPQQAAFKWHHLESDDYPTYMANLRAVGCPEQTIENIILADVEKMFERRATTAGHEEKFWQILGSSESQDQLRNRRTADLKEQERQLNKLLLGREISAEVKRMFAEADELGYFGGFVTVDKTLRTLAIGEKFSEDFDANFSDAHLFSLPSEIEQQQRLFEAFMAEWGQILTPAELEEAELRSVLVFSYLFSQSKVKGAQLSGSELRSLMQLKKKHQHPFYEELAENAFNSGDKRAEAEMAFNDAAKQLLGPRRFALFLRSHDGNVERFASVAERFGLLPDETLKFHELQMAAKAERARITQDFSLAPSRKRIALAEIKRNRDAAVRALLGPTASAEFFPATNQEAAP